MNWALRSVSLTTRQRLALPAFIVLLAYFLMYFDERRWQPTVDAAWALACVSWVAAFWRADTPSVPRLRHPIWFYALYVAALTPFATNWRWVMTGDNLQWPVGGLYMAEHGPVRSLLSVNGPDNFGYLQMALHDTFMLLIAPTTFWHHMGKIMVGVCALAGVWSYFARLVNPVFALLVAATAATCSVWIVYTYGGVPFIDGIASGYALLAVTLWVRRDPDSVRAWLVLGMLSGFMLFLTPNGWYLAICGWAYLAVQVVRLRWRVSYFVLAGLTGLIVGCPILIQWMQGQGGQLFSLVERPQWTAEKVYRFVKEAATIPFASDIQGAGAFGPQLPMGFRLLVVPGLLLTPIFARYFPGARVILALYVINVLSLAFSQGPYAAVSVKRALTLIPLATYFVFIPFHRLLRSYVVILPIILLWASFGVYDLMYRIQPGRTGYTFMDGIVEAHQRFWPATVCVYLSQNYWSEIWNPGKPLDRLYGLSPRLRQVSDVHDPACSEVLCYCPPLGDKVDFGALGYDEVPMLNSIELHCGRRKS